MGRGPRAAALVGEELALRGNRRRSFQSPEQGLESEAQARGARPLKVQVGSGGQDTLRCKVASSETQAPSALCAHRSHHGPRHSLVVAQSPSRVPLFAALWTAACRASLSFTVSGSLLKLGSIESVTPSNCLILSPPAPHDGVVGSFSCA